MRTVDARRPPRRLHVIALCGVLLGAAAGLVGPARAAEIPELGLWLSQDHDGVFSIARCGTQLCGRLVGMRYTGEMPRDVNHNPECNIQMLTGFEPTNDDDKAWEGRILDPDSGHVYHARIWTPKDGILKLRGYIGIPLFGETQTWTRFTGAIGPECKLR
ncbi:hypothetical protein AA103196_1995 [Ameyamaea chiangmaiensis NBRC 103196]|nr:hypothetical protein AA103196_1995 [Ameyamaea chiangmaiensis NBRC 103196]